jgi:hypothetical protein
MSARWVLSWGVLTGLLAGCAPLAADKTPAGESALPAAILVTMPPVPDAPAVAEPEAPMEAPAVIKEARPPMEDAERLLTYFDRLKRLPGAELAKEHDAARLAHGRAASDFNRISYAMTLALPGTPFNDDARALELLNPLVKKSENGLRPLVVLLTTFIQERRRLGTDLAAVQQKLDALKSLERKLIERDQNNSGRKP